MMEVNVRQERADDRALRRPFSLDHASIFEHSCRQPFGNQPDDSAVANPMLDETDQPILADFVEKGLNVSIEHPVDPPPPDPERERIQALMLVALRSETVAESQELRLIDRRQDCHHCSLDDSCPLWPQCRAVATAACSRVPVMNPAKAARAGFVDGFGLASVIRARIALVTYSA
jgi:hypothetical protein